QRLPLGPPRIARKRSSGVSAYLTRPAAKGLHSGADGSEVDARLAFGDADTPDQGGCARARGVLEFDSASRFPICWRAKSGSPASVGSLEWGMAPRWSEVPAEPWIFRQSSAEPGGCCKMAAKGRSFSL